MANAFLQCARICFPGAKTYRGGGFGRVGGGAVLREGRNGPKFGEEGEIRTNCIEEANTEIKCRPLTYCEYFGYKG